MSCGLLAPRSQPHPLGLRGKKSAIGSWNAPVLFHSDRAKLKRKIKARTKHTWGMDVFGVQEWRGSVADIHKHFRLLARDFWIKASVGKGYGGVITFVSKLVVSNESAITDSVVRAGRTLKIEIGGENSKLVIHSTRNSDFSSEHLANLDRDVGGNITQSRASPLLHNLVLVVDLNCSLQGAQLF